MIDYLQSFIDRWRTGTTQGQVIVLALLLALIANMVVVSLYNYTLVPMVAYFIPMLIGAFLLRFKPLALLYAVIMVSIVLVVAVEGYNLLRAWSTIIVAFSAALMLAASARQQSGLPTSLGQAMLVDLKTRLQAQSVMPDLGEQWKAESVQRNAAGVNYAGDFFVALKKDDQLDVVLVDVCGKGVAAGTQSLHFAGALGGLLGSLPPVDLFYAANDFLLRQRWQDGFATAAHVSINLKTGDYLIVNAGHPPALNWDSDWTAWNVDGARGIALGIAEHPRFETSKGVLKPGDGLMLYTDGVVESHSHDFEEGLAWLVAESNQVVRSSGFVSSAANIMSRVGHADDDRAILIFYREAKPASE